MTHLRLKMRKGHSTLPIEKLTAEIESLEILGESIEAIPSLEHLELCQKLVLICPQLQEIPKLPQSLTLLKIKGARGIPQNLPPRLETLQLSGLRGVAHFQIDLPDQIKTLDLSGNGLESISHLKLSAPLSRLNLDHNQLTTLPDELYQNKSLLHLSLDGNPLTEEEKDKVYKTFGIWF